MVFLFSGAEGRTVYAESNRKRKKEERVLFYLTILFFKEKDCLTVTVPKYLMRGV